MSHMFEIYYRSPADPAKEAALTEYVTGLGGRLDYREESGANGRGGVCLTFDFDNLNAAAKVADLLRQRGEHVEGPADYGPN